MLSLFPVRTPVQLCECSGRARRANQASGTKGPANKVLCLSRRGWPPGTMEAGPGQDLAGIPRAGTCPALRGPADRGFPRARRRARAASTVGEAACPPVAAFPAPVASPASAGPPGPRVSGPPDLRVRG
ncbi:hypothetical protein GCM10009801_08160 [Streptomyces albiaxialis]|uniref:Uncharacterized protein n=1 Tax=Streptomyces albiaxialis TaxID=329523 RepID=A0ABN2VJF3_9ACTN